MNSPYFLKATALAICIYSLFMAVGCQDPCKNVPCVQNQGFCVEGTCYCNDGYQGDSCSLGFNAKFVGTYSATDVCDSMGSSSYSVTIAAVAGKPKEASITGLHHANQGTVIAAILDDGLEFTLAPADVGLGTIEGTDTCVFNSNGSIINLFYRYIDENSSATDSCTTILTKQ
jgi:hypothetical protein